MPNILFKLGTLDLSTYVRVNPDQGLQPGQGDHLEPAFSDSPFFEGQYLTSVHAKNKEVEIPLFLHPSQAPYLQDELNSLVQLVNQTLRPVTDLGQTLYAQWQNAQAEFSTFFTVQFGRFEPNFNFRQTEKGWLAGILHLWTLPYGHTATERIMGTWAAPANQSGGVFALQPGEFSSIEALNPVAYWRLNEKMIPTVVDSIGSYMGTYAGSVGFLQAGAFPGDPAHSIAVASGAALVKVPWPTQFTAGVWIQPASYPANEMILDTRVLTTTPTRGFAFQMRGTQSFLLQMGVGSGAQLVIPVFTGTFVNNWDLAVIGWDGSYGYVWVNGQMASLAIPSGYGFQPEASALVGIGNAFNLSNPFYGNLQDAFLVGSWVGTGAIASLYAAGPLGAIGDVSPQFDLRIRTGSYTGDDGQVGLISALPVASYNPIIPVGSFYNLGGSASPVIYGASGAWASQFLAMFKLGGSQGNAVSKNFTTSDWFSLALSPASVYSGDNRILGLVRARSVPFGLRAFDSTGTPLGPTVIASAMDGWQVVDYGILSAPPWMATIGITIQAYSGIPYYASGMFSPPRAAPAWTKEHGPIFAVPNAYTLMELDWNSPLISMDGFDGASGAALGQDQLGNSYVTTIQSGGSIFYAGTSALMLSPATTGGLTCYFGIGTLIHGDWTAEALFTTKNASQNMILVGAMGTSAANNLIGPIGWAALQARASGAYLELDAGINTASVGIPSYRSGQWHVQFLSKGSIVTGKLWGPSGAYPGSASGVPLVATTTWDTRNVGIASTFVAGFGINNGNGATALVEAFRVRLLASTGHQSLDTFHLSQPYNQNTRMLTASGPDSIDLQARQRGPLAAVNLPVPSLGAGLFVASFNWDQGPANDLLNVAVRVRERFTYAR